MSKTNKSKSNSAENKALQRFSVKELNNESSKVDKALEDAWDRKLGKYTFGGKTVNIKSFQEEEIINLTKALKGFKYNKNPKVDKVYKELTTPLSEVNPIEE
jgi:hypothetical protein